jgi:hypothetical protein
MHTSALSDIDSLPNVYAFASHAENIEVYPKACQVAVERRHRFAGSRNGLGVSQ